VGRKDRYLVGLDVGTSKVCAIVGEIVEDNGVDVVGIGVAESRGIRRGVIVNLEAAVESIKKAVEEAELMAGVEIDAVHLSMAGPHIKGFNSRGVIAVCSVPRERKSGEGKGGSRGGRHRGPFGAWRTAVAGRSN